MSKDHYAGLLPFLIVGTLVGLVLWPIVFIRDKINPPQPYKRPKYDTIPIPIDPRNTRPKIKTHK